MKKSIFVVFCAMVIIVLPVFLLSFQLLEGNAKINNDKDLTKINSAENEKYENYNKKVIEIDNFSQNYESLDGKEKRNQNIGLENIEKMNITHLKKENVVLEIENEKNDNGIIPILNAETVNEEAILVIEEESIVVQEELIPETVNADYIELEKDEVNLEGEIIESVVEEKCFATTQEAFGNVEFCQCCSFCDYNQKRRIKSNAGKK